MSKKKESDYRIADASFRCAQVFAVLAAAGIIAWVLVFNATQISLQTVSQNINGILDIQREGVLLNGSSTVNLQFYDEQMNRIKNVTKLIGDTLLPVTEQLPVLDLLTTVAVILALLSVVIGVYFILR